MSVYSGDFLGFQLGDVHSQQLNITRVSVGDRYNDILIPNFQDTTVAVPGGDGTYYWDTFYTQKPFTIDFAFDDLRDEDIRKLRQVFGFKGVKPLIFDEFLYKKYMVKSAQPPNLKYICFDNKTKDLRIYKGEGQAMLVAYYPFAISTQEAYFTNSDPAGTTVNQVINNVGDLDAPFQMYFKTNITDLQVTLKQNNKVIGTMKLEGISKQGNDVYFSIDSKTHLIEGLNSKYKKTGRLYNKFITSGDFMNFPVGNSTIITTEPWKVLRFYNLYY